LKETSELTEEAVRAAYDAVPYPSGFYRQTHPDNLATRAFLHGMDPVPPERCRVLEIGAADGGNLIPMAAEYPESRFVGIDLSPRQVEAGRERVRALGLENLELEARSVLSLDAGFGTFDYILVHGVFSWVAAPVQEKILAVCRENLAPAGVAYVSYNTYPGWHARAMVRELMLYRARGEADLRAKPGHALELVRCLAEAVQGREDPHASFLRATLEHLEEYADRPSYLVHEYLEESNTPLYFHRFMEIASRHGLQFLEEADSDLLGAEGFRPALAEKLQAFAQDRIEYEQYLDFLRNGAFRRTLLCHRELDLDRTMVPERMARLHAASPVHPVAAAPDLALGVSEAFRRSREGEGTFSTSHPVAKAALVLLGEAWPAAIAVGELGVTVAARLDTTVEEAFPVLADVLYSLGSVGLVELHLSPPRLTAKVSERPVAAPLARAEIAAGRQAVSQTRHALWLDDPVARLLLPRLDGRHDPAALLEILTGEVAAGRLALNPEGPATTLAQVIERQLARLAESGLLVG
jgi:SAM-dependent methyltransferase/methyltransferase-like protein